MIDRGTASLSRLERVLWGFAFVGPALTITLLTAGFAHNRYFVGDFYLHAAAVRALTENFAAPPHPMLAVPPSPHPYLTPYSWLVAAVGRASGLQSVDTLAMFGVINVALFLAALHFFAGRWSPHPATAALALFGILMLWGSGAWFWSGFFHLEVLFYVAPYPATAAAALLFFGLSAALDAARGHWPSVVALLALLGATIMVHVFTALIFLVGALAIFVSSRDLSFTRRLCVFALAIGGATGLALCWPFFRIDHVLLGLGDFHAYSAPLYADLLSRTWPTMLVLPLFLWRLRADRRDPLVLFSALLLLIQAYGYLSASCAFGRVISYACMTVQIGAGGVCASQLDGIQSRSWRFVAAIVFMVLFAAAAVSLHRDILELARPTAARPYPVEFIQRFVHANDVVLSDVHTSWMIPAFAGKVIAEALPPFSVPDADERREALRRFFEPTTAAVDRALTLRQYAVEWILVNKGMTAPEVATEICGMGQTAMETDTYVLVHVVRG